MAPGNVSSGKTSRFLAHPRWMVLMICSLLILMVLIVYWQTYEFSFVNYDDGLFVYNNAHVLKGLTVDNVLWSLTAGIGKDSTGTDYWRPLSLLSHMLDVSMFGLNAGAHHLVSVALHALAAIALFLVVRGMTATLWRSAFVAAVFAVHPLHVESVAWVAERKDVLSGLFFALAVGAYHWFASGPFRWGRYLLLLLLTACAMMSKPMLVTLPFVLLLLDLWPLNRFKRLSWKFLLVEKAPLFLMAAATIGFTLSMNRPPNDVVWSALPWYYRAGNAVLSYAIYIKQTVWPASLTCFYPFPGLNLVVSHVVMAGVGLAAISALVWRHRHHHVMVVGWMWYLGMLLPVIGLFTQAGDQAHADRYTYLAMTGLIFMVVWPVAEWAEKTRARRMLVGGAAVTLLLTLTSAACIQVSYWRDNLSLWTHAIKCDTSNCAVHAHLGMAHVEAGRLEDAVASFRRALALSPPYFEFTSRLNLGITLLRAGAIEEAEVHMRRAILDGERTADARVVDAHSGLAGVLLRKGDLEEAIRHLQIVASSRHDVETYTHLGRAQLQVGRVSQAIESLLRGLAVNQTSVDLHALVAMAYASQGAHAAAARHYQAAIAVDPDHFLSLNNLAWLLATSKDGSLRDGTKAVQLIELALRLPGGSRMHLMRTLAAAYAETGEYQKAASAAREALSLAVGQNTPAQVQQIQTELGGYLAGEPWRE